MQRHRSFAAAVLAFATTLAVVVIVPSAPAGASYPLDPAKNIAMPAGVFGSDCTNKPLGATCQAIMINALNHARSVMGEPAYALPARFMSLLPVEQLLVLTNLDRKLYGRRQMAGLNATLNASALYGARHNTDPAFVPVSGVGTIKCAANWGGNMPSPMLAYYYWMYYDAGQGWIHRHNTLMTAPSPTSKLAMGAAGGTNSRGQKGWADLFEAFPSTTRIVYLPTVVILSSHSGPRTGGSDVAISGFGFGPVTGVTFGGVPASFRVDSLKVIHTVSPAHQSGKTFVRVTTRGGTSSVTFAAIYFYS